MRTPTRHLPLDTDPPHVRQLKIDGLKAAAFDLREVADRHVPRLRELGLHEKADELERLADEARARVLEFEA